MDDRRRELAQRLEQVRGRIAAACAAAGRADDVTLVVVTKTHPAGDIALLAALGVTDIGENRDQEARAKHAELAELPLRWHMLGQLQRNKAASVARWADVVESVDREPVAIALGRAAQERGEPLPVLLQVSLDPRDRPDRGGVPVPDAPALADAVAATPGLVLAGVMAVAPHPDEGMPPDAAFARLARVHEEIQRRHPGAAIRSAGMSQDLEAAIAHGATQVRLGDAVLGRRAAVQ